MGGVYAFLDDTFYLTRELHLFRKDVEEYERSSFHFVDAEPNFSETTTMVVGHVKLWGEVVEHECGWRAENAKVASLDGIYFLGKDPRPLPVGQCSSALDQLRTIYGVK